VREIAASEKEGEKKKKKDGSVANYKTGPHLIGGHQEANGRPGARGKKSNEMQKKRKSEGEKEAHSILTGVLRKQQCHITYHKSYPLKKKPGGKGGEN